MKRVIYILPIVLCLFVTSCGPAIFFAGAAAGIGGYKYYNGSLTVVYQAPYDKTLNASVKAIEELGFTIKSKEQGLTTSKIDALLSDGTPVTVTLKYKSSDQTEVSIRVGVIGDENASNVIKDKIGEIVFK